MCFPGYNCFNPILGYVSTGNPCCGSSSSAGRSLPTWYIANFPGLLRRTTITRVQLPLPKSRSRIHCFLRLCRHSGAFQVSPRSDSLFCSALQLSFQVHHSLQLSNNSTCLRPRLRGLHCPPSSPAARSHLGTCTVPTRRRNSGPSLGLESLALLNLLDIRRPRTHLEDP